MAKSLIPKMINYDNREPNSVITPLSLESEDEGIPLVVEMMQFGDYKWEHGGVKFGIERKAKTDLLSSLTNGRINAQLRGMIDTYDVPILLIEGWIEGHGKNVNVGKWKYQSGWNYSALFNLLLEFQMAGIFLTFSPYERETAKRIVSLYKWTSHDEHQSLSRNKLISIKEDAPMVTTLATFPGIGHKRARELMKTHSLRELLLSEDITKIVGKVTGKKVMEHLDRRV